MFFVSFLHNTTESAVTKFAISVYEIYVSKISTTFSFCACEDLTKS